MRADTVGAPSTARSAGSARAVRGRRLAAVAGCAVALVVLLARPASAQEDGLSELRSGHWLRIKGSLREDGTFVAAELELREPGDEESLIGTASGVNEDATVFTLLGQRIAVPAKAEWNGVPRDGLEGLRIEVEGHWRGPAKLSARSLKARDPGRDRIEGRVDHVERASDGSLRLKLMIFEVHVPPGTELVHEKPVSAYAVMAPQPEPQRGTVRDDDDDIPASLSLGETIDLGAQLEWRRELRDNYDLDDGERSDRDTTGLSLRAELTWEPNSRFTGFLGVREAFSARHEEEEDTRRDTDGDLTEAWGYWRDPFGVGMDLQVGRQDFDEQREWIYDENLDAVRLHWLLGGARLELSASTILADGSPEDRESANLIAYLTNDDPDRLLAAYVVDRRDGSGEADKPIFFGLRALGDWLPDHEVWAEWSLLRGTDEDGDLQGWGMDVGTTWEPPVLEPAYLIAGFARGTGDDDPDDGIDHAFRQTGLQDNNGKFGGVTSFHYYGEIVDPELTNLQILTFGLGTRLEKKTSADLVWHGYTQVEAIDSLGETSLKEKPDGEHRGLGQELDLVLGTRRWASWDLELVLGRFMPGDAFPGGDDAWLAQFQVRYRF